ncbi:hypothetical protein [Chelativorans salis]|uniref:Uncharacterized protein n=1 Tax=Chelativorans salis TaxID=2978478 RepID=A0ABT2LJS9_9HYPH|nr:hypothetical protein [Chelativorans sp. EGI FJ00035]MCT7373444.1 hypothetical protein [Chelativorans sp. EGI FJ00035]
MATILNFKRAAPRMTRRLPVPKGGAAIVIFPGVRYERRDGGKGAPLHPHRERERRTKS